MTEYLGALSDWRLERGRILSDSVDLAAAGMVVGDVAEFGIFAGRTLEVLANAVATANKAYQDQPRHLHGFDSFEGLPPVTASADADSPMVKAGIWREGAMKISSPAAAKGKACKYLPPELVRIFPGFFFNTLKLLEPGQKYAVVHLDCDLYQSTHDVLGDLFYNDRLSDGSILLFDDFLENRGSKHYGQRAAWEVANECFCPDFTDLGFYGRASWRCMIHRS